MTRFALITISLICLCIPVKASGEDTMTGIFNHSFHTLEVKLDGNDYAPPIIMLNSNDHITISFDEIADDHRYLRYSLVHCNRHWQPSELVDPEFLDGFNLGEVDNYEFSQLTTTNYIHYSISLPNDQIKFTVSGNYLLRVFPEENPDDILLQARFMVIDNTMKITGEVTSRTDVDYNAQHQQLALKVDAHKENVQNMYSDVGLVITQNSREDNRVYLDRPMRVSGKTAYYEHLQPLIFEAGNEYRRMETVSTTYPGMRVAEIEFAKPYYNMRIETDKPRYANNYTYDQTQHGHFTIREYNSIQSDIEADYVLTHFSLEMPELINADIFIDGNFTYRRFDPESMMIYNKETGTYEKTLLLKQGAYNYQYLMVPSGSMKGKTSIVEGNFHQTINEYLILAYHRPTGSRYDRLVGAAILYSGK